MQIETLRYQRINHVQKQVHSFTTKIASGTFGKISKSFDHFTQTFVAAKKLTLNTNTLREVSNLTLLTHPNVVRLLDSYESKGYLTIVLDLHPKDLAYILSNSIDFIDKKMARDMLRMVLHGVAYCHAQSVIHRDIKPENILVSRSGVLILCDFGHSKCIASTQSDVNPASPKKIGSRPYKAPEILNGTVQNSPKVDVWSVGCVYHEIITGRVLFSGATDLQQLGLIYAKQGYERGMSLEEREKIGEDGLGLLGEMLSIDLDERISANDALEHAYFHMQDW